MTTRSFFDQMGQQVSIDYPPRRIISLVPSQTELLADLGLQQEVIGITRFCVHPPEWLKTKRIVGGTKDFNYDIIGQLKPDLIIGNKEENFKEGIEKLRHKYPVWMSDVVTLQDAKEMISAIGELTDTHNRANQIRNEIQTRFEDARKFSGQSVIYFIWRKPWMAAGPGTFIHSMLTGLGLQNAVHMLARYPELTNDEIMKMNADWIFLSTEPYPFREKHIDKIRQISPHSKIKIVDGEMFSWFGSRLIKAEEYFNHLNLTE